MAFKGIVGQEKAIESLKRALEHDQVAHAYLFEGAEGLGKKAIALELASALVCNSNKDRPCGKCSSCVKVSSGNHPEIKVIEGEGTIKVDEIRELIKDIQLKPYEGTRKAYIICNADKMNIQAQNALLKTLEEPPLYVTLILLTTKGNSLLPTIVSRCQTIKLNPVRLEDIKSYLINNRNIDMEKAQMLAAFSGGIVGRAIELLDNPDFHQRREGVIKLCNNLMGTKLLSILDQISFFEEQRPYTEEIFDLMTSWYRDLMVYKETGSMDLVINVDKKEEIDFQVKGIDLGKVRDIIFIIEKAKKNLKSNVQFHLNIEVMLLNIQEVLSKW